MIMDSLEPIAFGEPNVHFHHLLNFDTFKTDVTGDEAPVASFATRPGPVPPALVVRASEAAANVSDSLNTPISTFMELPIFFGTSVLPPPPSMLAGKTSAVYITFVQCLQRNARSRKTRRCTRHGVSCA